MDYMGCFFTIILILGIFILYIKYQDKKLSHTENKNPNNYKPQPQNNHWKDNYSFNYNSSYMPYARGHLLTKTEHSFFITLVREALKRRLLVCPKVRLEDIIFVTDKKNRDKFRGYIKSRHVDFVLINANCETVAAIELDDPSHEHNEAKKTDRFKNDLFQKVKIPLIRIKTGTDYITQLNIAFDNLNLSTTPLKPQEKTAP